MDLDAREVARGALAGFVGAALYAAEIPLDTRLTGYRFSDLVLLGRMFSADRSVYLPLGTALHLGFGSALGAAYTVARRYLPGSRWTRGTAYGCLEYASLVPALPLVDRYHPGRSTGELDRAVSWKNPVVMIPRHVLYGLVLSWLAPGSD